MGFETGAIKLYVIGLEVSLPQFSLPDVVPAIDTQILETYLEKLSSLKFCEGFEISQNAEDLTANGTVLARAEIHSRRVYLHNSKTGDFNTEIKSNLRHRAVNCQLLTATSMACSIDYTVKNEEELERELEGEEEDEETKQ